MLANSYDLYRFKTIKTLNSLDSNRLRGNDTIGSLIAIAPLQVGLYYHNYWCRTSYYSYIKSACMIYTKLQHQSCHIHLGHEHS